MCYYFSLCFVWFSYLTKLFTWRKLIERMSTVALRTRKKCSHTVTNLVNKTCFREIMIFSLSKLKEDNLTFRPEVYSDPALRIIAAAFNIFIERYFFYRLSPFCSKLLSAPLCCQNKNTCFLVYLYYVSFISTITRAENHVGRVGKQNSKLGHFLQWFRSLASAAIAKLMCSSNLLENFVQQVKKWGMVLLWLYFCCWW